MAIHNEVLQITRTISGVGGTQVIEISAPNRSNESRIIINEDTKRYVRALKNQRTYGETTTIQGRVSKLFISSNVVEIKTLAGDYVKVHLSKKNLAFVRYRPEPDSILEFTGRPFFKFGIETADNHEFEADEVHLR